MDDLENKDKLLLKNKTILMKDFIVLTKYINFLLIKKKI